MADTKTDALGRTAKPGDPATKGGKDKDSTFKLTDWMPWIVGGGLGLLAAGLFGTSIAGGLFTIGLGIAAGALLGNHFPNIFGDIGDKIMAYFGDAKAAERLIETPDKAQQIMKDYGGIDMALAKEITGTAAEWQETLTLLKTVPGKGDKIFAEMTKDRGQGIKTVLADSAVISHVMKGTKELGRRQQLFEAALKMSGVRTDLVQKIIDSTPDKDPKKLITAIEGINKAAKRDVVDIGALAKGDYKRFFSSESLAAMLKDDTMRSVIDGVMDTIDLALEADKGSGTRTPAANPELSAAISEGIQTLLTEKNGATFKELYSDPGAKETIVTAIEKILTPIVPGSTANAPTLAELVTKYKGIDTVITTLNAADTKRVLEAAGFKDGKLTQATAAVSWLKQPRAAGVPGASSDGTNLTVAMDMLKAMQADGANPTEVFETYRTQFSWTNGPDAASGAAEALRMLIAEKSMFERLIATVKPEALAAELKKHQDELLHPTNGIKFDELAKRLADGSADFKLDEAIKASVPAALQAKIFTGTVISNLLESRADLLSLIKGSGVEDAKAGKVADFIHENKAQWKIILGEKGMGTLANMLRADSKVGALLENPAMLFSNPDDLDINAEAKGHLKELQTTILKRARDKDGIKGDTLAVEKAIAGLKFDKLELTPLQLQQIKLFQLFVTKGADVPGIKDNTGPDRVSNLDHLGGLKPEVLYELMGKLSGAFGKSEKVSEAALSEAAVRGFKGLNFDDKDIAELIARIAPHMGGKMAENVFNKDAAITSLEGVASIAEYRKMAAKGGTDAAAITDMLKTDVTLYEHGVDKFMNSSIHLIGLSKGDAAPEKS